MHSPARIGLFSGDTDNPEAASLRAQGNTAFQAKQYHQAIEFYTRSIDAAPGDARLYSNRSAAYGALHFDGHALADALMATTLQPAWPKGHFRLGVALIQCKKWVDASDALERSTQNI